MKWRHLLLLTPLKSPNLTAKRTTIQLSHKTLYNESTDPKKAPIVLLHGLFGNKHDFKEIAKTLMNITKRLIVVADLRNHGDSPHAKKHTYTKLADDVEALLVKLKIDQSILVGHSMGGRTAMTIALTKPKLVAGLVVIDISPVSNCFELKEYIRKVTEAMARIDFKKTETKKKEEIIEHVRKQLGSLANDPQIMAVLVSNIVRKDGHYDWQFNLKTLLENYDNILGLQWGLGKYNGPTLFIGGSKSHFIPADDLTRIRDLFPRAVLMFIPETGHIIHGHEVRQFLELVTEFIRSLDLKH